MARSQCQATLRMSNFPGPCGAAKLQQCEPHRRRDHQQCLSFTTQMGSLGSNYYPNFEVFKNYYPEITTPNPQQYFPAAECGRIFWLKRPKNPKHLKLGSKLLPKILKFRGLQKLLPIKLLPIAKPNDKHCPARGCRSAPGSTTGTAHC